MIKEYLLSTDNFTNPKVVKGVDAVGILLIRLLLMVPGTNPLHPQMGVGIGSLYRFIMSADLPSLETRITEQITTYLPPQFSNAQIKLDINDNKYLVISILIDNTEYVFDTESSELPVQLSDSI